MTTQKPDEPNGKRRAELSRWMLGVALATLLINFIGATTFWFAIPERVRNITEHIAAQDARITVLEGQASGQGATLARVDERTKAMSEDLHQLRQDFYIRASGNPTK